MPKPIANPGEPCDCHGAPMQWNARRDRPAGGYWMCRVRANERKTQSSRRQGHAPFGSEDHLQKQREAHLGRQHPSDCTHCLAQTGERNVHWSADGDMTYGGAHQRHRKALAGLPCAHADESCKGRMHSALRAEVLEAALTYDPPSKCWYSPHSEDYMPLCASHHRRYDLAHPRPTVSHPTA